ncbi:MAG: phosphoenolpyruvate--protein phosphotransferase [SAR324 cluster bacterium]|uniref:phosphoenolpyruvate--protein phosphotransferase n=1 Tax=SAR324 cluster bacterium TaxID=2024889 RepID=A0A2A4T0Z3_9DELT|nr:MAG: phosphoenolpyruvate--protein phosphotransferase [SAR324 cluster bacterium]
MESKKSKSSKQLSVLEEICEILTQPHDHEEMLNSVVSLVKKRLAADVCSLYLLDDAKKRLILKATLGLNSQKVGQVSMAVEEGITGLVVQRMAPVAENNVSSHPRYKYFPDLREEEVNSFLGVPLISRKKALGVLIVQYQTVREFSRDEIRLMVTIASQLTGVILNAELLQSIEEQGRCEFTQGQSKKKTIAVEDPQSLKHQRMNLLKGIIGSAGMSSGKAYILQDTIDLDLLEQESCENVEAEIQQFHHALQDSIDQISHLMNRVKDSLSEEDSAIFHAHLMILDDRAIGKKIVSLIQEGNSAVWAVREVTCKYIEAFSNMEDPYLRERAMDMKDIGRRVIANLQGTHLPVGEPGLKENSIIVAEDITPSQMISLDMDKVNGFILANGGKTSHVSLLAKSYDIPALVGVGKQIYKIKEQDTILLNCQEGMALYNPAPEIMQEYSRVFAQKEVDKLEIDSLRDLPAVTTDGKEISLLANIGLISDLKRVDQYKPMGVGLYRTEFYFLAHTKQPTEEEQTAFYTRVLQQMGDRPTKIRTLDVGGDKFLPYLEQPREQNPFLGWRSIRMSLDLQGVFRTQLRSLLRASVHGDLGIMFPMISGLEELRQAKAILEEERCKLLEEGIAVSETYQVGMMVEVPSAVYTAEHLIEEVDFFSLGTNDLIQYTLAVDRNNPKVAKLYDSLHPAIWKMIHQLVCITEKAGKPLSICGEMASDPLCAIPLIGIGVRNLSMISPTIPVIKKIIRKVSFVEAQRMGQRVLELRTPSEIRSYLQQELAEIL